MTRLRKQLPVTHGAGELRFRGASHPVTYEITGDPATLRPGPLRLRGALSATPEIATDAFRAGEADLVLEGGTTYRIVLLGHTAGSGTAHFEMRV